MKKLLYVFSLIAMLFLGACVPENTDNIDKTADLVVIENWIQAETPSSAIKDVELPSTHPEKGGEITWDSTDDAALSDDGTFLLQSGTVDVLLEYSIKLNGDEKVGFVTISLTTVTFDEVASQFAGQFNNLIARDYYGLKTSYIDDIYTVTWNSSNEDIFSNLGHYNAPEFREEVTINYTVKVGNDAKEYSLTAQVVERSINDKGREIQNWIKSEYLPHRIVNANIVLPDKFEKYRNGKLAWVSEINWYPSNKGIISEAGVITQYGFDRYVNLLGEIIVEDQTTYIDFDLIVPAKAYTNEADRINDFLDAIAVGEIEQFQFKGYANITQTYNFLPFYTKVNFLDTTPKQIVDISAAGRPGTKLSGNGVEFITIHDTANTNSTANAQAHANIQTDGYPASWHFQTDEDGAIQSIPLDEVAYHAGDGSATFGLNDTGVKADHPYPDITIGNDRYYYINGQKSNVLIPESALVTAKIASSGIYTEIGVNGNYYINNTYFNKDYGVIVNKGGNRNSIGIESAVNYGSDYGSTLRHTANLVAELLIEFDLTIDRVMQHNNFSGKHCPRTLIDTNYWSSFLDLISLEKYAKENLPNVEFAWTSNSDNLTNDGKIDIDSVAGTVVSYSVEATYGTESISRTFTTTLR